MILRLVAAALIVGALAACTPDGPDENAAGFEQSGGDVVIATGTSRSGAHTEYYVECGADPTAELGDYRVLVSAEVSYTVLEGAPCPAGPREPMPHEEYPELYEQLSKAMDEPLREG